ncbi:MAG: extracellular solute-binding protein [Spirochaetia bacterium]|nr:extracellular solute-binding protein [Spirochaetia bacterium]
MKKLLIFICILLIPYSVFAGGSKETTESKAATTDDWEKFAQLGKYTPETEDWAEIEKKAKEEGKVVIYSNSSRVYEVCRGFYEKYKIKAEPNDITTPDMLEKLSKELAAGVNNADIIMADNIPELYNEFESQGLLYKYYPSDIKKFITPEALKEKLAVHHYGSRGVLYNNDYYKKPPIKNIWELTKPEWKGRIITKDPMNSGSEFNFLATLIQHSDDMAKAYKEEFGTDIVLDGTENAGYEFLKRLLNNDLILLSSSDPVLSTVAAKGVKNPPVGLISLSKIRNIVDDNLSADIIKDLKPVMGMQTTTSLAIVKGTKYPNAAKLLSRWMMGEFDYENKAGYSPYYIVGNWSPRTDFEEPADQPDIEGKVYYEDADWLYKNAVYVRDFWIQHQ